MVLDKRPITTYKDGLRVQDWFSSRAPGQAMVSLVMGVLGSMIMNAVKPDNIYYSVVVGAVCALATGIILGVNTRWSYATIAVLGAFVGWFGPSAGRVAHPVLSYQFSMHAWQLCVALICAAAVGAVVTYSRQIQSSKARLTRGDTSLLREMASVFTGSNLTRFFEDLDRCQCVNPQLFGTLADMADRFTYPDKHFNDRSLEWARYNFIVSFRRLVALVRKSLHYDPERELVKVGGATDSIDWLSVSNSKSLTRTYSQTYAAWSRLMQVIRKRAPNFRWPS